MKTSSLSSAALALFASLLVTVGCSSTPAGGGAGGSGGGAAGAGGEATGSGGSAGGSAGMDAAAPHDAFPGTMRITLLGDSTTSDGCYRSHLWQMLRQAGHMNFDFVGTRTGDPGCTFTGYDRDNEGHGGYIVTDVLKATSTGRPGGADSSDPFVSSAQDLATWFDGHPTDLVLMNFGTNDVSNNISATMIVNAFSAILAKLRANNPNVQMMVAQIPPIAWVYCTFSVCEPRVQALNSAIVTWAQQNSTADSPVSAVDLHTGYDDSTDTVDGVHANDSGSTKIATAWFNAVAPLF